MAEPDVILLSSDDGIFVSPHRQTPEERRQTNDNASLQHTYQEPQMQAAPVTLAADAQGPTRTRPTAPPTHVDTDVDIDLDICARIHTSRTAEWATPAAAKVAAVWPVDVIAIDDTPAPAPAATLPATAGSLSAARVFRGFSSDDMLSSPFPGPTRAPSLRPLWAADSPTGERARAVAERRPIRDAASTNVASDSDGCAGQARPTKRPRLSPGSAAECIDIISSSDSDADRTVSTQAMAALDSDFADIDDLLLPSSPPKPDKPPTVLPPQNVTLGDAARGDVGGKDVVLLSSSPVPVTHAPSRRRPLQRSVSEGGRAWAFAMADNPDEPDSDGVFGGEDNAAARVVDDLLAAWRKDHAADVGRGGGGGGRAVGRRATRASDADSAVPRHDRGGDRSEDLVEARDTKRREREAARDQRQRDKAAERERRKTAAEAVRAKKAEERATAAALQEANRSRVDKAVAAPEMTVRLPATLPAVTRDAAEEMLTAIQARFEAWAPPVDNVVAWQRTVTTTYRADLGHWVPVDPPRVEDERHAMVVLRGEDLVQLILAGDDDERRRQTGGYDLSGHVRTMTSRFANHTIVYLVEGLGTWRNRNRALRNRQFAAAVRSTGGADGQAERGTGSSGITPSAAEPDTAVPTRGRRAGRPRQARAAAAQHVEEAVVDDALLDLQMEYDGRVLVHETQSGPDTARWIRVFTEQLATAPYRRQKEALYAAAASFCMDSGQIATGDGGADVYVRMLQQIGRVTEPVARGVAARFDSLPKLVRSFRAEGPLALEACLKSRNRDGALSDRTIGPALSRRIYKVVMGTDPASTDV